MSASDDPDKHAEKPDAPRNNQSDRWTRAEIIALAGLIISATVAVILAIGNGEEISAFLNDNPALRIVLSIVFVAIVAWAGIYNAKWIYDFIKRWKIVLIIVSTGGLQGLVVL